jgi:hypothetical protein
MSGKTHERRREPRVNVALGARVRFSSHDVEQSAVTVDLSPEGALLRSARAAAPGQGVLLELQLDAFSAPIECKARVTWAARLSNGIYSFGVRFLDLRYEEAETLQDLVSAVGGAAPV